MSPDVSVTSVGVQAWTDTAVRGTVSTPTPTDMDLVIGERLRWTLSGDRLEAGTDVVGLVDGRFTIDAGPGELHRLEWSQVRQAGIEVNAGQWTVDLGRHPVYRGGPRLVDGVQALYVPSPTVRVGVWGGLAPNLFTTLPELRPGGGPIVSYATSKVQASAVGEVVLFDGGLARAGVLSMARISFERRLDLSARLDLEAAGPVGPRLVDAQLMVVGNPTPSVRLDALYNEFSSYRYIDPADIDPDTQRFVDRLSTLGLAPPIRYDEANPTLNHLVGGGARFQPDTDDLAPRIALTARYRVSPPLEVEPTSPALGAQTGVPGTGVPATTPSVTPPATLDGEEDPANTYIRLNPQAGLVRVGGVVDLLADVNWVAINDRQQFDTGLVFYVEPSGAVALDGSARLIAAPGTISPFGWYGDLFVNLVSQDLDLLLIAGGMVSSEPDVIDQQSDLGFGAFLRLAKYVRPPR